jgi:fructose-1-phosphate kinase PfkB-like protein
MEKRPADDSIRGDTIDQRIDWAAVVAGALVPGRQSKFSVYDPGTGVSHVIARVGSPQSITTPAGSFAAIQIDYEVRKRGRIERFVVFATQRLPRFMIREDFPNGVTTELLSVGN